jgi:hypothetical protein
MGRRESDGSMEQDMMLVDSSSSWMIVCRQSLLGSEWRGSIHPLVKLEMEVSRNTQSIAYLVSHEGAISFVGLAGGYY